MRNILICTVSFLFFSCGKKTKETTVLKKDIHEYIFASGTLKAEDAYYLKAESEGYITKLDYQEGDKVTVGNTFAIIENRQNEVNLQSTKKLLDLAKKNTLPSAPQLGQIRANIDAAKEKVTYDQRQVARYEKLLRENSIAKVEYENMVLSLKNSTANLKALSEQYDNLLFQSQQQLAVQQQQYDLSSVSTIQSKLKIIVAGKIYELNKKKGDYVRKGDIIAYIANPNKIYANLSIDETNMGKIKLGQAVILQLNTNQNKPYQASIEEIKPIFDEQAQSFFIKAQFLDSLDFRIPGTQLEANISVGQKKDAVVIPTSYLGYGNKVMLQNDSFTIVKTGIISSDWVEITEGLSAGTIIKKELE